MRVFVATATGGTIVVPACSADCRADGEACDPNLATSYGEPEVPETESCASWCRVDGGGNTCGEHVCRSCDICEVSLMVSNLQAKACL